MIAKSYISKGDPLVEFTEYRFFELSKVLDFVAIPKTRERWASRKWFGGTYEDIKKYLTVGDLESVELAKKLAKNFDSNIDVENLKPSLVSDVVGGAVSVGSYLAGAPNCMLRTKPAEADISSFVPCRVFLPMDSPGSFDPEHLRIYGSVCLSLVLKLQTLRPVELYTYSIGRYSTGGFSYRGTKVKLGTTPMDLSSALSFVTRPCLQRALIYSEQDFRATGIRGRHPGSGLYRNNIYNALDAQSSDIVLPIISYSEFSQIRKNPVDWIQNRIQTAFK